MGTVSRSVTLNPSGSTGQTNFSVASGSAISNGYTSTSSTTYARFTLSTSTTGYIYYTFDCSEIPSDATITSITGTAKVRRSSTTRVTSPQCQLYTGTTAKGTNVEFSNTSGGQTVTLSPGTGWTRANLNDLRLKIGGTGSTSSQSKQVDFYGANVVITYSVTTYDITITNNTSATVTASDSSPAAGDNVEIFADTITGITITDNNTDVTSQFTQATGGTVSAVPGSYDTGGSINGTNYQSTIGKGSDTANRTGNDYFSTGQGQSGSTWIDYFFDFSSIPLNATIQSTSLTVKGHCESTTESREISRVQAYSGSTEKGSYTDMTDQTTDKVYTVSIGTWTAAELHEAKIRHTIGVYGGLVSGATWTVTYTVSGYVYTISSVAANHAIVVSSSSSGQTIYYKAPGGGETEVGHIQVHDTWSGDFSVDLSSISSGDTVIVQGGLYVSTSGVKVSGSEYDISTTFTWNGISYSYTVGYYTLTIYPSKINILVSGVQGTTLEAVKDNDNHQYIVVSKSSGGGWTPATAVYKKVSGSWVLQSNLSNVFDSNTNYVKG